MLAVAIAAAAGWLGLYAGCAAATGDRRLRRGIRRIRLPIGPSDLADPALVNLVTTGCRLDGAAFAGTILQLRSLRLLTLSEPEPGRLWCAPTGEGADELGLASYEQLVLADVTRQFAGAGGAPFEALADLCFADVMGVWIPFEKAVRAEGRRRGLTWAQLPRPAVALLLVAALPVAGLAVAAAGDHNSTWWVGAGLVGLVVLGILVWLTGMLARGDRLTPVGAALAAWAIRAAQATPLADGDLGRVALMVATDGAPPVPGLPWIRRGDVRRGGHRGPMTSAATPEAPARAPGQAWSLRDGEWRLVPVDPRRASPRMVSAVLLAGSVVAFLAAVGGYDGYRTLQPSTVWILLPAGLLTGSMALAVAGVRAAAHLRAVPAEVTFDGHVIARWTEEGSGGGAKATTVTRWFLALDDGERVWPLDVGQAAAGRLPLGARIRARIAPRSMRLLDLAPLGPEGDVLPSQPGDGARRAERSESR